MSLWLLMSILNTSLQPTQWLAWFTRFKMLFSSPLLIVCKLHHKILTFHIFIIKALHANQPPLKKSPHKIDS